MPRFWIVYIMLNYIHPCSPHMCIVVRSTLKALDLLELVKGSLISRRLIRSFDRAFLVRGSRSKRFLAVGMTLRDLDAGLLREIVLRAEGDGSSARAHAARRAWRTLSTSDKQIADDAAKF